MVQLSNLDFGAQRRVFVLLTRRRRHIFSLPFRTSNADNMKVVVKHWHAVAQWRWDIGTAEQEDADNDNEGDVCGICRVPYEGCCPSCKVPGDDCPLSAFVLALHPLRLTECNRILVWGECTHVFHMHCLLKWIGTAASKQQCPMDRRTWGTSSLCTQNRRADTLVQSNRGTESWHYDTRIMTSPSIH